MRLSLTLLLLWCGSMAAVAEDQVPQATGNDDSLQWLQKMTRAMHALDYEGRFVFHAGGQLEAMDIQHQVTGDGEHERLTAQSGESREVIRDNDRLLCISEGEHQTDVTPPSAHHVFSGQWLDSPDKLLATYRLQMLGQDRMAGRAARIIAIVPLDDYRYGYRIWLDEETALLLKSDLLTAQGQILEQLMFTRLRVVPSTLASSAGHASPPMAGTEAGAGQGRPIPVVQASAWRVAGLPKNFELREVSYREGVGSSKVEHRLYSDGLATVSVFIEPATAGQPMLNGASSMGAMNAYGINLDGYQVTVVGEVPEHTVRVMAQSLSRENPGHD